MSGPTTVSARTPGAAERLLHYLDWRVIRRLDGLLQGDYHTLFYGHGLDFADIREYEPRDDIRHIDWNVTARMHSPYVRQYVEDREITAWFLVDTTPSMTFGPAERPKLQVLRDYVATLARLLTRSGNRVGAIVYNGGAPRVIPPHGGRKQVLRLIHEIDRPGNAEKLVESDLQKLLYSGLNSFRRRSLLFVISDFISVPGWERPLSLLNQRHEMIAVRLWDPRETELPDAGMIYVEDVETGEQLLVDTSNAAFRRRFQAAAEQREAALQALVSRAGVDLFAIATTEDIVSAIVRMAALRKQKRM